MELEETCRRSKIIAFSSLINAVESTFELVWAFFVSLPVIYRRNNCCPAMTEYESSGYSKVALWRS